MRTLREGVDTYCVCVVWGNRGKRSEGITQSRSGRLPEEDVSVGIPASRCLFRLSLFLEVMCCPAGNFPALLQRAYFSTLTRRKLNLSLPEQLSWPHGILIALGGVTAT